MRRNIVTLLFVGSSLLTLAQGMEETPDKSSPADKLDKLVLDVNHDRWIDAPDSINTEIYSRGVHINLMYDIPLGESPFAFAIGLGIGSSNIFTDATVVNQVDSTGEIFTTLQQFDEDYDYDKNKLSSNYLDIPLEFRFRTKPNEKGQRFKVTAGAKIGYLINMHSKTIDKEGKYKTFIYPTANDFRYGAFFRIGYGKIGLNAYYSLSPVFDEGKAITLTQVSAGLSFLPF